MPEQVVWKAVMRLQKKTTGSKLPFAVRLLAAQGFWAQRGQAGALQLLGHQYTLRLQTRNWEILMLDSLMMETLAVQQGVLPVL